jgi:hypothetical protein
VAENQAGVVILSGSVDGTGMELLKLAVKISLE